MENEPRQSAIYEQIISSLSSGVLAVDAEGAIITANAAAARHLNADPGALLPGRQLAGIPDVSSALMRLMAELRTERHAVSRREVTVGAGDDAKVLGMTASPLQGPLRFNGAIFLFIDLTDLRRLEKTAELNKQLAQIGELTAGVVHELRNPLSVIAGMSELLIRKSTDGDPVHQKASTIFTETKHMEALVSQFLSFAKPFELAPALCTVEYLLERSFGLVSHLANDRQVHLESRLEAGLPVIHVDGAKMTQAISNILRNAIEVSPAGGRVRVQGRLDDGRLTLNIADEGPGIHLEAGDDLFSAFFSKKEGGTGLGLSIVHRIVTAHEGSVTFGNNEGPGAWFEIRLPLNLPQP